jgi:hypothetical protein
LTSGGRGGAEGIIRYEKHERIEECGGQEIGTHERPDKSSRKTCCPKKRQGGYDKLPGPLAAHADMDEVA